MDCMSMEHWCCRLVSFCSMFTSALRSTTRPRRRVISSTSDAYNSNTWKLSPVQHGDTAHFLSCYNWRTGISGLWRHAMEWASIEHKCFSALSLGLQAVYQDFCFLDLLIWHLHFHGHAMITDHDREENCKMRAICNRCLNLFFMIKLQVHLWTNSLQLVIISPLSDCTSCKQASRASSLFSSLLVSSSIICTGKQLSITYFDCHCQSTN